MGDGRWAMGVPTGSARAYAIRPYDQPAPVAADVLTRTDALARDDVLAGSRRSRIGSKARTLRGTLQYDGTAYAGFQWQRNALSIQGAVETAIGKVTGAASRVTGAGRTDAGVHARGQVISFVTETRLETPILLRALNATLPRDIVLRDLVDVEDGFNARYSARSRAYEYIVHNAPLPSPFWRLYSYHVAGPLDVEAMGHVLGRLLGEHDFAAFGRPMEHTRDGKMVRGGTVRTMLAARCWSREDFVYFYVEANAFLRHMVRQIVGAALKVGQRRMAAADVLSFVHRPSAAVAGPAAPAHGLYLVSVTY